MEALAEAGANVVGIDASEGYLEGARRNRSHTNIPYEHGDIRHMSSTAVLSTRPFQRWPWAFLPEFEQVVAEIKRVTRPGGVVASGLHQFLAAFPHSTSSVTPQPFLTLLLRAEVHAGGAQALLAKWSGGVVAEDGPHQRDEAPVVVDCECPLLATFTSGQGSMSGALMALSNDVRGAIEQHVRARYLVGSPDGPRSFPMMFRVVRGVIPA